MKTKTTLLLLTGPFLLCQAQAAVITVNGYAHATAPDTLFPDSGTSELTDGVTDTPVWSTSGSPTTAEIAPLVGWRLGSPATTFTFDSVETVRMVQVWAADSDGNAGVDLPPTITVRTPDSSFSQIFPVTNPAGNGTMVQIDLTGFEVTTDMLVIEPERDTDWVMLTEVRFDTVPEPGSIALLGLAGLGLLRRRR